MLETGTESDSSFSKSQHQLPDLLHLSVHPQPRNNRDKYVGEFLWQGGMFKKGSRTLGISMVVLMHSLLCLGFTWVLTES